MEKYGNGNENEPFLKIEKINGPNDSEMSFCLERGGIITSMIIDGVELFYFDKERFNDPEQSDRGGAPVLFPVAGPSTKEGAFSNLKQHGFARNSENWEIEKAEENEFIEILESNDKTRKIYPYNFELRMKTDMDKEGSITLIQEVENKGENEMPISMGLHPYFNVPEGEKEKIKFDFDGGENIEGKIKDWLALDEQDENYGAFLERIDNPRKKISVNIPGIGTIKMDISKEYEKIWIWTERDKNFICVEPVMRDNQNGEIIDGPKMIKSGKIFSAEIKYSLEN